MAARGPQLNDEQRAQLLQWLAADYSVRVIRHWMQERGWPALGDSGIYYHRERFAAEIDRRRTERRSNALNTGLALVEERVERLKDHADELEAVKGVPDEKGKLHNEKAWRETLDDIAKETGGRRAGLDLAGTMETTVKAWVDWPEEEASE